VSILLLLALCGPLGDYTITNVKAEIKDMAVHSRPQMTWFDSDVVYFYIEYQPEYLIDLTFTVKNNRDTAGIYPIRFATFDIFGRPFLPMKVHGHVLLKGSEAKDLVITLRYSGDRPEVWKPIYIANDRRKPTGKTRADLIKEKREEKEMKK